MPTLNTIVIVGLYENESGKSRYLINFLLASHLPFQYTALIQLYIPPKRRPKWPKSP
jgi:hypothetical protein